MSLRRAAPAIALPLLAIALVALVSLSAWALRSARFDLTEHGLYTLSDGTANILARIDEPVRLRLYFSESELRATSAKGAPEFLVFAKRVVELLEEIEARSNGKVTLEIVDPTAFSEEEDDADAHGLRGVALDQAGGRLFFGLVGTNSTDGLTTMPYIDPKKEQFLEYDIAKLIASLTVERQQVVAMLSGLPTGPGMDPITGQPTLGWIVDQELAKQFEVRRLQDGPSSIGDDVDLLMVVHPKNLPEQTLRAIDQFVLRGGRMLAFVDPDAESDVAGGNLLDPLAMAEGRSSDLAGLFRAWGIQYDPTQVVLDSRFAMLVQPDPSAPPVRHLAILGLNQQTLNQGDIVSADLETLNLSSAGSFSLAPDSPLKAEPLVQTSSDAALGNAEEVRAAANDPRVLSDGFKVDAKAPFLVAARLTGNLPTAFPGDTREGALAKSSKPANIILVADTDLLSDRLWIQFTPFLGQQIPEVFANNGEFVLNAVDNLVGDSDLIRVRTRATSTRPFVRLDSIRRSAEERFRIEEKRLQDELASLEQRLEQLQPTAPGAEERPLTPAQHAEVAQFQQRRLDTRKALRAVQRQLNADIEAIEQRLLMINVLAVPLLLLAIAGAIALRNRLRRRVRPAAA
jgi:ABC-type uncharacterized transport system involved in gliding motility auxiliary subunit